MSKLLLFCLLLSPLVSLCLQTDPTTRCRNVSESTPLLTRKSFLTSCMIGGTVLTAFSQTTAAADDTTPKASTLQRTFEESLSGMVAGASLPVTKTLVKYPLDTATVRLQMPNSPYSVFDLPKLFKGSYRGITVPLLSNIPAGAVFFAVKDAAKEILSPNLPKWLATSLAVGMAQIPYWLVRNPSEVVKTRQQAGIAGYDDTTPWEAVARVRQDVRNNRTDVPPLLLWEGFYVGYWENILYAYPADVLKFVIYEQLAGGRRTISPAQGALVGAAATALSQFMTTPLDVVRNRLMVQTPTESREETSYFATLAELAKTEGIAGLFAGVAPRVGKALISGAIQFATYEETKQSMTKLLQKQQQ